MPRFAIVYLSDITKLNGLSKYRIGKLPVTSSEVPIPNNSKFLPLITSHYPLTMLLMRPLGMFAFAICRLFVVTFVRSTQPVYTSFGILAIQLYCTEIVPGGSSVGWGVKRNRAIHV